MDKVKQKLSDISVSNIKNHIKNLEGIRHPVTGPDALANAEAYIEHKLASCGHEMSAHFFEDEGKQYRNILAVQKGALQPETIVAVIAHFDTVAASPGADDNASGVAAMLEISRVLSTCTFRKSLYYVGVNLEEPNSTGQVFLRGSRALAADAKAQGWDIAGVINFETIAYAEDAIPQTAPENLPVSMPEKGNFIAVVGNESSASMVQGYISAVEKYHIPLECVPLVVPGNGEVLADTRRSDHAMFWDQGYPAIMLTDTANFRSPHYHQPSDTLDTINLPFTTEVCRAGAALAIELAGLVDGMTKHWEESL